ncbi:MAG: SufD family Fe-S cluster assembly protein, partial [Methanobacteriota archaeon]
MLQPEVPGADVGMLSEEAVRDLSASRDEPGWMLSFRLASLESLLGRWGAEWARASKRIDLARLLSRGPTASRRPAAAGGAHAASEATYRDVRTELAAQGVTFVGLDAAVREAPELVRPAFGAVVTADDGPYAALNGAVWSGGSFLHVPRGVRRGTALQAEIREDFSRTEPFERNLLVLDEGAYAEFIDGCTAPIFTSAAIHASVVELVVRKDAQARYTTLQNWSKGVDNVVAKRAHAYEGASVEWIEANLGSRRNVKAPSVHLLGRGAHAEVHTFVLAGRD